MNIPSYFREAKKARASSDHPKFKVGACLLYKGRVVSIGFNQILKSHPLTRMFNEHQTIHAEVSAIVRCKNKDILKDCTMVVYREGALGNLALAKPCPTCRKILKFFKIRSIAYTIYGGYVEEFLTE